MSEEFGFQCMDSQVETKCDAPELFFLWNMNGVDNVYTLADAFLCIASMTHKKLQKLCYYAKAWHLALYDRNIIPEHFEAWVHGAVQPGLYQRYKDFGSNAIPMKCEYIKLSEDIKSFAHEIYDAYGHLSGNEL